MTAIARRISAFLCARPTWNPNLKRADSESALLRWRKGKIMVRVDNEHLDISAIADSGQTFRFNRIDGQTFEMRALNRRLLVRQNLCGSESKTASHALFNNSPVYLDCSQEEYDSFWKDYFDLQTDYGAFLASIPAEDDFLTNAGRAAGGIRILRQDPWEMLISFLISQRKNIPAIKSCIEKISSRFGTEGAFPTIEELAGASRDELAECSLGYRTDYVLEAARAAAEGKLDLYAMKELPDEELRARLLEIKGVGVKVANCVMLFGYHRIAAFPIDVWIARIIKEQYGGTFPVERYEGFAGVIQQYMFYYGRNMAGKR